jgi:hypothetical protein
VREGQDRVRREEKKKRELKTMLVKCFILFLYLFIIVENPLSFFLDVADVVAVISAAPYMAYDR